MDLHGSLVDTNLRLYPTTNLLNYFKSLQINEEVPINIVKLVKGKNYEVKQKSENKKPTEAIPIHVNSEDIENLNKIRATIKIEEEVIDLDSITKEVDKEDSNSETDSEEINTEKINSVGDVTGKSKLGSYSNKTKKSEDDFNEKKMTINEETKKTKEDCNEKIKDEKSEIEDKLYLTTPDIDWLYGHLQKLRSNGEKNVPYLHVLLEGVQIATPENKVIKRNPVLEARCVKLRAQQEAREYRKMTKSVDNVRMRFPEDSISYQLKQVNRQLIAIGQFIISIFAGFLFGFKGLEWMIGPLDFGFRLLLGVMCALIIALAEIYFLAKKLNEELNIPETVQLGGPPKFVDQKTYNIPKDSNKAIHKDHQD